MRRPVNITTQREIRPEGRMVGDMWVDKNLFLIRHIKRNQYSCDWCGAEVIHKPKGVTGQGPLECPTCGLRPFFVETSLIARYKGPDAISNSKSKSSGSAAYTRKPARDSYLAKSKAPSRRLLGGA